MALVTGAAIPHRTGTVLVVAVVIIFALASMTLVLGKSVRVEMMASANQAAAHEAAAIARGAEQYLLGMLAEHRQRIDQLDRRYFEAVPLGEGYFWIIYPDYNDPAMPLFGVAHESGKLNLNTAREEMLMRLPGMDEQTAAAIAEWRGDARTVAAGVYARLPEPYTPKYGPLETVEELMLVHGITRELLWGREDGLARGRTGRTIHPFAADFYRERGIYDLLTVRSIEPNVTADRRRRLVINNPGHRMRLRQLMIDEFGAERGTELGVRIPSRNLSDLFDLANVLGLHVDELRVLEDRVSHAPQRRLRGRININAAPREVLLCIEQLADADVDALLSARAAAVAADPTSIAWVYDVLGERAVGLGQHITGQGYQFAADILAVSGDGRAFQRVRLIVDTTRTTPRITYRRDWTDRGWPLDSAILTELRRQ